MTKSVTEDERNIQRLSDLLSAVGRGDQQAFEHLYSQTSGKLFGICRRMMPQRSDAEDALQEIYITVWRKACQFNRERGNPISWLCMLARNKCIDKLRLGPAQPHLEPVSLEDEPELRDQSEPLDAASNKQLLERCLAILDAKHQTIIRTAFFDGCTYENLATRTGTPLGTIKSWIRRGLSSLKACLEQ